MEKRVRTRFAPSPTGELHLGGLRTALFNYLLAKSKGGDFLVRIEDTDQERLVEGATERIFENLAWAGLEEDESLKRGGQLGPYVQSERLKIYQKEIKKLLEEGKAYPCFCNEERLKKLREDQAQQGLPSHYDRLCLGLQKEEIEKRIQKGDKYVIRLRVPDKDVEFNDLVRGKVRFKYSEIDDQVLLKSDGFPTYHWANIVDDHYMQISHVLRGEEWLSSTPKHIILYEAMGWEMPHFGHLSMLLNEDRTKMSKRSSGEFVWVKTYREKGFLPEALLNFVALLGWNPKDTREFFSLEELVEAFDIKKLNKSGPVFDLKRLEWMNAKYIKKMDFHVFEKQAQKYLLKRLESFEDNLLVKNEFLTKASLELEKERVQKLDEVGEETLFLFLKDLDYSKGMLIWKKSTKGGASKGLELALNFFENLKKDSWRRKKIEDGLKEKIKNEGMGMGDVLWPLRVALTGKEKSPGPFESAEILGEERVLERIKKAIALLKN
jgi:glutamyl-tRNA synthetase